MKSLKFKKMEFTKSELKEFRKDLENSLEEIKEKYNISIDFGAISYEKDNFSFRASAVRTINESGEFVSPEQIMFNKHCRLFKVKEEDYKKIFSFGGMTFELTGFKPKSPKYSVLAMDVRSKKTFKLPFESLNKIRK